MFTSQYTQIVNEFYVQIQVVRIVSTYSISVDP